MRKSERTHTHSLAHSLTRSSRARSFPSGQQQQEDEAAVARDDGIVGEEGREWWRGWRVMTAQKADLNWPQLKIEPLRPCEARLAQLPRRVAGAPVMQKVRSQNESIKQSRRTGQDE